MGCSTHDSSQVPSDKSIQRRRVESPRCERSPCGSEPRSLHGKQRHMRRDMCCMRIANRPTIDGRGPTNPRTTHSANWNTDHAKQLRSRITQDSHERVRTRVSALLLPCCGERRAESGTGVSKDTRHTRETTRDGRASDQRTRSTPMSRILGALLSARASGSMTKGQGPGLVNVLLAATPETRSRPRTLSVQRGQGTGLLNVFWPPPQQLVHDLRIKGLGGRDGARSFGCQPRRLVHDLGRLRARSQDW